MLNAGVVGSKSDSSDTGSKNNQAEFSGRGGAIDLPPHGSG